MFLEAMILLYYSLNTNIITDNVRFKTYTYHIQFDFFNLTLVNFAEGEYI